MRRFAVLCAALGLNFAATSNAPAQPTPKPHMELVRGLRNNGMADLALEYLDELKAKNPPPAVAVVLPLEYARTWIDLASQESEEGKRAALIAQARRDLNVFINANPKHPQAPQANVDLARLLSLQARSILLKARRVEDEKLKKAERARARAAFKEAADKYKSTAGLLDKQLKAVEDDKTPAGVQLRRELTQFRLRAQIDQAINLVEMAETFDGEESADVIERGNQIDAAKKIFTTVAFQDDKEPLSWVARAWAAECDYKAGRSTDAEQAFKDLLSRRTNPAAAAGVRVARYFGIFHAFEKNDKLDARGKFLRTEKEAADWLHDYPSYRNTPEGVGARYYLAFVKLELGKTGLQREKGSNKVTGMTRDAKAYLEDAQRLFKELAESENEYTEKANRHRSQILVTMADAEGHGDSPPPEVLGNFERCYLMAQVQLARLAQYRLAMTSPGESNNPDKEPEPKKGPAPKKSEPKKADSTPKKAPGAKKAEPAPKEGEQPRAPAGRDDYQKEEHRRYTNAIRYLEYGLALADPAKDSVRDIFSAKLLLVGCYHHLKLYPQAAVLAEHIARENPKMGRAPVAGIVAVQAYNVAFSRLRQAGDAAPADLEADTSRLRGAAEFVVKQWPLETATDEARHILGFFLARDKRYEDAWKVYSEIKPSYPAVNSARLEMASIMFTLVYPADEKDPAKFNQLVKDRIKQHEAHWKLTLAQLDGAPVPDAQGLRQDAVAYLESRSLLARMHQLEGDFAKARAVGESLAKSAAGFEELKPEEKENFTLTGQNIVLNCVRAGAYEQFKAGNHAKVAELLNPVVAEVQKEFAKESPKEPTVALQRLRKSQRDVVVLALQSAVQDQKIDRAGELLDLLEKSGNTVEGSLGMLRSLVTNVRTQIDELEKDGKKVEAEALKDGFTKLLDKIAGQGEKLPPTMKMFIAQGYQGVDAHAKATKLLEDVRKMPAPALPAGATEDQQAKYNEARDNYDRLQHQAQFLLARNHRAAKEYDEAIKILTECIGPKVNQQNPVPKNPADRGWAFASMDVRKEKAHTLEERAKNAPAGGAGGKSKAALWGEAVQEWVAIQKAFASRLVPNKEPALTDLVKDLPPDEQAKYAKLDGVGKREYILGRRLTTDERDAHDKLDDAGKKKFVAGLWEKYQGLSEDKKNDFVLARMTPAEQQQFANEAAAVTAKRRLYFELYFEQKRCSVKAYADLGVAAVGKGGPQALQERFAKFAQDFDDFRTKNKDLPQPIKDRLKDLIEETPMLKDEYKKLKSAS